MKTKARCFILMLFFLCHYQAIGYTENNSIQSSGTQERITDTNIFEGNEELIELFKTETKLALIFQAKGDYDKSFQAFLKLLHEYPDNVFFIEKVRELALKTKQLAIAVNMSSWLVSNFPERMDYLDHHIVDLLSIGNFSKAIKHLETLVERYPRVASFREKLIQCYEREKQYERSIEHVDWLIENTNRTYTFRTLKAKLLANLNLPEEQLAELEKLSVAYPLDIDLNLEIANLYISQEDLSHALHHYALVVRQDPSHSFAKQQVGYIQVILEKDKKQQLQAHHDRLRLFNWMNDIEERNDDF